MSEEDSEDELEEKRKEVVSQIKTYNTKVGDVLQAIEKVAESCDSKDEESNTYKFAKALD